MRIRPTLVASTLLLSATACGGGDDGPSEADLAAITRTATEVVTTDDATARETCETLLTAQMVTTVFLDQQTCREPGGSAEEDTATGATVTDIEVDGDTATAVVTEEGGDSAGATGQWSFARDGAGWRVSQWSADYLRSQFRATFGPAYRTSEPSDPFRNERLRTCFSERLSAPEDAEFLANAYEIFRQSERSEELFLDVLFDCGDAEVEPGVTLLRQIFEDGLRTELDQLPTGVTDCVLDILRREVSDTDLQALYREDERQAAALAELSVRAGEDCARQTAGGGAA